MEAMGVIQSMVRGHGDHRFFCKGVEGLYSFLLDFFRCFFIYWGHSGYEVSC